MSKAIIFAGILAAGVAGFIVGKKLIENNPEAVAAVKENCSEKFHQASVCCVGAIKTGKEKLSQGVNNIVTVGKEKGTVVLDKVKSTGANFKNEINNLKDMVVSINKNSDNEESVDAEIIEDAVDAVDEVAQNVADFTFAEETDGAEAEETL